LPGTFAERHQGKDSARLFRLNNIDGLKIAENRGRQMKSSIRLFSGLFIIIACAAVVFSQTNRGGVSGVITDHTGAVISGAEVVVINIGSNREIRLTTSADGAFSAPLLEPVLYRITVTAPGFKKATLNNIKVDTGTTATVNVTLELGAASAEVTVTAETVVPLNSGTPGQTITERQISEMPLNNRSVLDLMMFASNVSGEMGTEDPQLASGDTIIPAPGFNVSINGGRMGTTSILADGANNTGVGLARAVVTFSPDTVQEFTVQTSNFSAEYGNTGGGVVNMTTKSGTNQYRGLAYWYHRNPALNAAPWTMSSVNRPVSARRQHQLGLTFGGPVWLPKKIFGPAGYDGHDKTFFFVAFEPRYYYDGSQGNQLLPNDAMRRGDFSDVVRLQTGGYAPRDVAQRFGLQFQENPIYNHYNVEGNLFRPRAAANYEQFPNNVIPQNMLDPIALQMLQYVPKAGDYYLADGNLANYVGGSFIKNREYRTTIRLDHQISSANRLSGRYTQVPIRGDRGSLGFEVGKNELLTGGTDYSWSKQVLLTDTHVFGPRMVNELRANYTYGRFSQTLPPEFDTKNGRNLSTELGLPSVTQGGMPVFTANAAGVFLGFGVSSMNENREHSYELADNFSLVRGNMTWKFGVNLTRQNLNLLSMFGAAGGIYNFTQNRTLTNSDGQGTGTGGNELAQFLIGTPVLTTLREVLMPVYYQWNSYGAFAQNDWKVRRNLTLNLGLRYSLFMPRTEKYDRQGAFLLDDAREFTLPNPITLPDGTVVTKALAPPYAFAGRGGRSRYLTPADYMGFEPRFGFAWSPKIFGLNKDGDSFVLRGGYGISHMPLTGLSRSASPDYSAGSSDWGSTDPRLPNPGYAFRLTGNVPNIRNVPPDQYLKIPEDGLIWDNSRGWMAVGQVISSNYHTPYMQSWSLTASYELMRQTVLEIGYVGSKGTHLFTAPVNINRAPQSLMQAYRDQGLGYTANGNRVNDPLNRTLINGGVVQFPNIFLGAPYLGFDGLFEVMNAGANSNRNAMTVSLRRNHSKGLSYTANYTWGKSIDDSSDSGGVRFLDLNVRSAGQSSFGAPRSIDRSISLFDIKHVFNTSFLYDLPFGRGRSLLSNASGIVNHLVGGWGMSGLFRVQGGLPMSLVIRDDNGMGWVPNLRTLRPDVVPGVPLKNPRYDKSCPTGPNCEPYFNPAAFMRPVRGAYGDAPRAFDSARGPAQHFFDLSVQKNFSLGKDGKRSLQIRVDAINVFNHPIYRVGRLEDAGEIFGAINEGALSPNELNAWAMFNGKPSAEVPEIRAANQQIIINNRVPRTEGLRPDFFRRPLPEGFFSMNVNSFDITTEEGFALYRLRQSYSPDRWGFLSVMPGRSGYTPRFIQFALKINF
jgi:hypothetical protein